MSYSTSTLPMAAPHAILDRVNEIDEINEPKAHGQPRTVKFPQIIGNNRSEPDPTAGSRAVKCRFLPGDKMENRDGDFANNYVERPGRVS